MSLYERENVSAILAATGGDFLVEMLEYLDFDKIKRLEPKWVKGYSDITGLTFLLTTICDIATIYGENAGSYGMRNLSRDLLDSFKIMSKEEIEQKSFDKYEKNWMDALKQGIDIEEKDPLCGYDLENEVKWKNLNGENKITIKGRSIGGCLDVITNIIGTKYDNISSFIEKYKDDGILWYLEIFDMSTPQVFLNLWKMKNAGYFKYCKGIVFGRSLSLREDYGIDFKKTVLDVTKDLEIPIIYDADIGHLAPTINIVNGAILEITSENGKGIVKTYFK